MLHEASEHATSGIREEKGTVSCVRAAERVPDALMSVSQSLGHPSCEVSPPRAPKTPG